MKELDHLLREILKKQANDELDYNDVKSFKRVCMRYNICCYCGNPKNGHKHRVYSPVYKRKMTMYSGLKYTLDKDGNSLRCPESMKPPQKATWIYKFKNIRGDWVIYD